MPTALSPHTRNRRQMSSIPSADSGRRVLWHPAAASLTLESAAAMATPSTGSFAFARPCDTIQSASMTGVHPGRGVGRLARLPTSRPQRAIDRRRDIPCVFDGVRLLPQPQLATRSGAISQPQRPARVVALSLAGAWRPRLRPAQLLFRGTVADRPAQRHKDETLLLFLRGRQLDVDSDSACRASHFSTRARRRAFGRRDFGRLFAALLARSHGDRGGQPQRLRPGRLQQSAYRFSFGGTSLQLLTRQREFLRCTISSMVSPGVRSS